MVLVGVQPSFTHVPPTCSRSTKAVCIPAPANARARGTPPCPAPTTIASYRVESIETSLEVTTETKWGGPALHSAPPSARLSRNRRCMNVPPHPFHLPVIMLPYNIPHSNH